MKVRAGIIGSSGGAALIAAMECLKVSGHELEPVVLVDRDCGMSRWARNHGHTTIRLDYINPGQFSIEANAIFRDMCCDDVLLFYSRLVADPMITERRVWNIHPSLLPAFVGMRAVQQAMAARVRLLGATLHRVDAELDTGPIISQVGIALPQDINLARAERLSYIQKVWLTLNWFEAITNTRVGGPTAQPYGSGVGIASSDISDATLKASFLAWSEQLESAKG